MTQVSNGHRLHNVVYAAIEAVAAAERITKVKLAELSRDLLMYVPETNDIEAVNRLISVLTPMNKATAILYFTHFLPWEVENVDDKFHRFSTKLKKEKALAKKMAAISEWLADEQNTIWSWADANVQLQKKKDFAGQIKKAIEKALAGDEKSDTPALTMDQVVNAIFETEISLDVLMAHLDKATAIDGTTNDVPSSADALEHEKVAA